MGQIALAFPYCWSSLYSPKFPLNADYKVFFYRFRKTL
jgi:hypothetical protein